MIKKCVNLRQLKINFLNIHSCKKKKNSRAQTVKGKRKARSLQFSIFSLFFHTSDCSFVQLLIYKDVISFLSSITSHE